uniref:Uncharacterized protein n=1 Tax=Macaca fascicularis TaxID=9541 RepID=A0A7N9CRT4_MACFA
VCWRLDIGMGVSPQNATKCVLICSVAKNNSRVHVHNVQVCYLCIHVPCWCAASINSSFTLGASFLSV